MSLNPSPFLALPTELRTKIYEQVLPEAIRLVVPEALVIRSYSGLSVPILDKYEGRDAGGSSVAACTLSVMTDISAIGRGARLETQAFPGPGQVLEFWYFC